MTNQIDDYVKRPMRYENIDGLKELGFGAFWIVVTLLNVFFETTASASIWQRATLFLVCLAALPFIVLYGRKVLRKRITYPRTGYVKYWQGRGHLVVRVTVLVAVIIAAVFVLDRLNPHFDMMGTALPSAMFGLIYAIGTRMDAVWRWVVLVVLIVAPPAVAALPLGHLWSHNLPYMVQGLIFFLSGAIALALYLRRNPVPEQVAE